MEEAEKRLLKKYREDVKWLRDRVPPDDIYDFAQQMIMSAEDILEEFGSRTDVQKLMDNDDLLRSRINNVIAIQFMKDSGFDGIISVEISIRRT